MELSGYIAVIRRWWWTLLVAAWVAGLTGFLVASQIQPTYESRVQLLTGPINTDANTLKASGQLVQTYAQIVTTEPLLDSAIRETGLSILPIDLAAAVRATANDVTRILSIRVQAGSPEDAATLANSIANELIQLASRGIGRPEGQLQIIEAGKVALVPVAPQVSILVLLAAAAGLIGALVIVLLVEYLSDSIRSREDLVRASGGTSLGVVRTGGTELIALPSGRGGQSHLLLAAKLILGHEARQSHSIMFLDATSTRTAAVLAANVTSAIGRLGRRALVIDGAGGQPGSLTRLFNLEGRPGVSDYLVGARSDDLAVMSDGIAIVPRGTIDLPSLDVDRCRKLVASLSGSYDVILIATAPVTDSPLATVWARASDGAVLVAERDHSRRVDVALATESLTLVERPLLGVVLAERGRRLASRPERTVDEVPSPAATRVRPPQSVQHAMPEGEAASASTALPASMALPARSAVGERPAAAVHVPDADADIEANQPAPPQADPDVPKSAAKPAPHRRQARRVAATSADRPPD